MTAPMAVRVMVEDAWDEVFLELPDGTSVSELKRQALEQTHITGNPSEYLIKYRGAAVSDETRSLAQMGFVPNSVLIILAKRRRPVR